MTEQKSKWNSIIIHIPEDMVARTSKGKVTIKPTMTKSNNLAKANKQPSIQIKTDKKILNPVIENNGEIEEVTPPKKRNPSTKPRAPRQKPIPKDNRSRVEDLRAENDKLYASLNTASNMTEKKAIMAKVQANTAEINALK